MQIRVDLKSTWIRGLVSLLFPCSGKRLWPTLSRAVFCTDVVIVFLFFLKFLTIYKKNCLRFSFKNVVRSEGWLCKNPTTLSVGLSFIKSIFVLLMDVKIRITIWQATDHVSYTLWFTYRPTICGLKGLIIIIIIIITTTIFIVLSSTAPAICESSLWFLWTKVRQRQVAANS